MDPAAFDDFDRQIRPSLLKLVQRMGAPRDVAEDVVQDAMISMSRRLELIDETKAPAYARRAVTNAFIDAHRKDGRQQSVPLEDTRPAPEISDKGELSPELRSALRKIPRHQAEMFLLRNHFGMAISEIAIIFGYATDAAAKSTLHRAKLALRSVILTG